MYYTKEGNKCNCNNCEVDNLIDALNEQYDIARRERNSKIDLIKKIEAEIDASEAAGELGWREGFKDDTLRARLRRLLNPEW
jgi:hypothetical protein